MKKMIAAVMSVMLTVCALPFTANAAGGTVRVYGSKTGDLDGDGMVTAQDASQLLMLYSQIQGSSTDTSGYMYVCDVNGNGKIEASDATLILKYYADQAAGFDRSLLQYRNYIDAKNDTTASRVTRRIDWIDPVSGEMIYLEVEFNKSAYDYYSKADRTNDYSQCGEFIDDESNREVLKFFADEIEKIGSEKNYTKRQKLDLACEMIQNIPYVHDIDSRGYEDYPKYPVETLFEYCGDCEDLSFMLGGIIREMGYNVAMLLFNDHLAVGVNMPDDTEGSYYEVDGRRYYYLESTNTGWRVGKVPDAYKNISAYVYVME